MAHKHIILDAYNDNAHCDFVDLQCTFNSCKDFVKATKFPFNIGLLSWEPQRCHYVVERPGQPPTYHYGDTQEEFLWISENEEYLRNCCIEYNRELEKSIPSKSLNLRQLRTIKMDLVKWVLERHEEEKLLQIPTTLTDEKIREVLTYRQALRDITKTYDSIDTVIWPPNPLE